jgi:CRP/FNR family transcriptional regulator, cyclic AMP receptor protein
VTIYSYLTASWSPDARFSPSANSLARIVSASRTVRVPAGRRIFRQGDPADGCYLIIEGAVKVTVPSISGQETLLAILTKGDIFGEMALLDQLPRSATVTTLRACELCHISAELFDRLAEADAEIARQLLRVIAGRLRAGNHVSALHHLPLRMRLAGAFVHLAQTFGQVLPDGRTLIRQKISQAELGHMIGAARENVNRQLAEWRRDGLLTRISGYYCLESRSAFEDFARGA